MYNVFTEEIKKSLIIDREKLAQKVYVDMEDDEAYKELADMIDEAEKVALPKAAITKLTANIVSETDVYLNDVLFTSKILVANLKGSKDVYGVVATCGEEIAAWAAGYRNDPLLNYYADTIMLEVLGAAVYFVNSYLSGLSTKGLSHQSPGSTDDFPIANQRKLFEVVQDVKEKTGVILTPEFLMKPLKSISAIYFTSDRDYADCSYCNKTNCPNRKKPYDEEMYNKMYN